MYCMYYTTAARHQCVGMYTCLGINCKYLNNCTHVDGTQVFQSAIMEAKKYKASGGDTLADMLDLLSAADKVYNCFVVFCTLSLRNSRVQYCYDVTAI